MRLLHLILIYDSMMFQKQVFTTPILVDLNWDIKYVYG